MHRLVDRTGLAADIFMSLGEEGINIELIATSSAGRGRNNISFAVLENDLDRVLRVLNRINNRFRAERISVNKGYALITIHGPGLSTTPGIAGKIFSRLSEVGINIEMISASLSILSVVIAGERADQAVAAIKAEFVAQ
jgi:aspartate kinase